MPSLIPALVPAGRLAAANASVEVTRGVTLLLGPLIGVAIAVSVGFAATLLVNAASFMLAVALMWPVGAQGRPEAAARGGHLSALRGGVTAIAGDRVLKPMLLAETAIFVCFGGTPQLMVILIGAAGRPEAAGLFGAGLGAGWLIVSLTVSRSRDATNPIAMFISGAAATIPVAVIAVLSVQAAPVWAFLAGAAAGAHNLLFALGSAVLCQRRTASEVLGRVFAFRRTLALTAQLGSLALLTLASQWLGMMYAIVGAGVLATVAALPPAVLAVGSSRAERVPSDRGGTPGGGGQGPEQRSVMA
jgi:hypothetical protein